MTKTDRLSPKRLDAVEAYVRALVETGALPHAQFLAARDGEVLHAFHTGKARADGRLLCHDSLYRIASMTKPVTTLLFLMLVEEGRVALDDCVASVLPELADLQVFTGGTMGRLTSRPASRQPTMLDLLRHTSGFTYGIQQHDAVDQAYWRAGIHNFRASLTRDGVLADLAALPLAHDPGARFTYGFGIDLIGLIAERLTGRSLGDLFAERVFVPLGMADTGFAPRPDQMPRLTDAWADHPRQGRYVYDTAEASLWARPSTFESGGGGLLSTVADYHRFCRMMLGEGAPLLKPETLALMTRNHLPGGGSIGALSVSKFSGPDYERMGQGLGLAVALPGGDDKGWPVGTATWSGLFSTWFSIVPQERLVLIFMTQLLPLVEDRLIDRVHRMLLA